MKKLGVAAILLLVLNTLGLWVLSKSDLALTLSQPYRALGQVFGLVAATLVSAEFVLATRMRFLDKLFGALDKVYRAHTLTGSLAFLFMLNHPLMFVLDVLPNTKLAALYLLPSASAAYNYGLAALFAMMVLLSITLFVALPYRIWKYTHAFMIVPQVLIMLHILLIPSDVSTFMPLRVWMLGLGAVSIVAYAYRKLIYPSLSHTYHYEVVEVKVKSDITEITMLPLAVRLRFMPGQFLFLSLDGAEVGREEHPFSISSGPRDEKLRVSVKASGDYTKRLLKLKAGARALVHGPYGALGEASLASRRDDIWIAGGIGITPFLSLLRHHASNKLGKKIWLFHSNKSRQEAVYKDEIEEISSLNPDIHFVSRFSSEGGRLNARAVAKETGGVSGKTIIMCGPKRMTEDLIEQFMLLGVHPRNIITEEFNFLP